MIPNDDDKKFNWRMALAHLPFVVAISLLYSYVWHKDFWEAFLIFEGGFVFYALTVIVSEKFE